MLKATYTSNEFYLEYCPEPLDLLLSDRVCMYAHAQRSVSVQPSRASVLLLAATVDLSGLERCQEVEVAQCDHDWLEITLAGLWITEDPAQEVGIFMTELDPRLEQRLLRLWQLTQQTAAQSAIAR